MEIKGEDFLKNLEIEKEKLRLKEQSESLDKNKQSAIYSNSNDNPYSNYIDDEDNELDDIVLEEKKNNKQKYIALAFAFILLFLITIIIIRLLSDPVNKNSFDNDDSLINDKEIQTINNDNIKDKNSDNLVSDIQNNLDIEKTQKEEEAISNKIVEDLKKEESIKSDVFNIKENESNNTNKVNEKIIQTNIDSNIKKEVVEKNKKQKTKKEKLQDLFKQTVKNNKNTKTNIAKKNNSGFYVQVGAFTQEPNAKLIKTLKASNYNYILHKMTINDKLFTKVLVGPYITRKDITNKLNDIRKITNNKKAYIMELK